MMRSPPGSHPARNESTYPFITCSPNINEWGETWDDVRSSLNHNIKVTISVERAAGSQELDVGQSSLDPVEQQVVSEQVVRE